MKRIKIFLGGYINYTNAQNINCLSIAKHIDKNKFKPYALTVHFGSTNKYNFNTFNCFKYFKISKVFGFLWGIIICDVAYLPKHIDTPLIALKLAKLLKKPIFTTIEGNVSDRSKDNLIDLFGDKNKIKTHFSYFNQIFPITTFLSKQKINSFNIQSKPLYLGVESKFSVRGSLKKKLNQIIFVGSLIKRKNVDEVIRLAAEYPNINFKIIGDGPEKENLIKKASSNVTFLGLIPHHSIINYFKKSDLLFLPSKSEGFPKVILEAAYSSIPSVLYDDYGASEWIVNRKNGFIVSHFEEVRLLIAELIENPLILQRVSRNVKDLASFFDWRNIIKNWELVIFKLYNERK